MNIAPPKTNGSTVSITCDSHIQIPISELEWFQGNLAEASKASIEKLKKSILRHGIFMAFAVWDDGNKKHIIDGHARLSVLRDELKYGGMIPVDFVKARSIEDAKEKVLLARSQTNRTTEEGLFDFASDLDWQFLPDMLDLPDVNLPKFVDDFILNKSQEVQDNGINYRIEISCDDESSQQKLYERFVAEGLNCRILTL